MDKATVCLDTGAITIAWQRFSYTRPQLGSRVVVWYSGKSEYKRNYYKEVLQKCYDDKGPFLFYDHWGYVPSWFDYSRDKDDVIWPDGLTNKTRNTKEAAHAKRVDKARVRAETKPDSRDAFEIRQVDASAALGEGSIACNQVYQSKSETPAELEEQTGTGSADEKIIAELTARVKLLEDRVFELENKRVSPLVTGVAMATPLDNQLQNNYVSDTDPSYKDHLFHSTQ